MDQTKLRSAPEATVDPGLVSTSGVQTGVYGQGTVTPTLTASVTSSIGGTTNLTSTSTFEKPKYQSNGDEIASGVYKQRTAGAAGQVGFSSIPIISGSIAAEPYTHTSNTAPIYNTGTTAHNTSATPAYSCSPAFGTTISSVTQPAASTHGAFGYNAEHQDHGNTTSRHQQGHGQGKHNSHGKHKRDKDSTATKGARFDETGGQVDDRTALQKLADKLSPGSAVGKHTSDVAGFAPNAGPSHGYETGTGPTRFTTGNVATDNNPISNSRTDIAGPTRYATSTSKRQVHSNEGSTDATGMSSGFTPDSSAVTTHNFYDEGPKYITNENGDVLGIAPRTPGTSGAHSDYHGSRSGGTPKGGGLQKLKAALKPGNKHLKA